MYGENQVTAAFLATLVTAAAESGVVGFEVLARNPQNMLTGDGVLLVDRISTRRIGFQGRSYYAKGTGSSLRLMQDEEWIEEIVYQVSALRRRLVSDGVGTLTQDDAVSRVQAWLNGARAATLTRARTDVPFALVHVSDRRTVAYQDSGEQSQRSSQIDVRIQVVQRFGGEVPTAWPVTWEAHGI